MGAALATHVTLEGCEKAEAVVVRADIACGSSTSIVGEAYWFLLRQHHFQAGRRTKQSSHCPIQHTFRTKTLHLHAVIGQSFAAHVVGCMRPMGPRVPVEGC
jgi:hypothetical protein